MAVKINPDGKVVITGPVPNPFSLPVPPPPEQAWIAPAMPGKDYTAPQGLNGPGGQFWVPY